ncbi:hypothetical protein Tco_0771752 [Tanacetum coccineum]|uniref:Uncharacterized protein n=1 Tax=Tanacetum coccineum TaxID=301880 RepID=A0ABQ4ZIK0_9ASTR
MNNGHLPQKDVKTTIPPKRRTEKKDGPMELGQPEGFCRTKASIACVPPHKKSPMAKPTEMMHLTAINRNFRYLKGTIQMGLWYPKDSGFERKALQMPVCPHDTKRSTRTGSSLNFLDIGISIAVKSVFQTLRAPESRMISYPTVSKRHRWTGDKFLRIISRETQKIPNWQTSLRRHYYRESASGNTTPTACALNQMSPETLKELQEESVSPE